MSLSAVAKALGVNENVITEFASEYGYKIKDKFVEFGKAKDVQENP